MTLHGEIDMRGCFKEVNTIVKLHALLYWKGTDISCSRFYASKKVLQFDWAHKNVRFGTERFVHDETRTFLTQLTRQCVCLLYGG